MTTLNARVDHGAHSHAKVKKFREWLRQRTGSKLAGDDLINYYIEEAYSRGSSRAYSDVRRRDTSGPAPSYAPASDPLYDAAHAGFHGAPQVQDPANDQQWARTGRERSLTAAKVKLLASRTFNELEGVGDRAAAAMSRALAEGLMMGRTPLQIARTVARDARMALDHALMVVRTELVRAHAEGQLDALEALGETGVEVAAEWVNANDSKVCKRCAPMEGKIIPIDKARGMIPAHPSCRCSWIPVRRIKPKGTGKQKIASSIRPAPATKPGIGRRSSRASLKKAAIRGSR